MEENKSSFYEFLAANSKVKKNEVHAIYLMLGWIILFILNSTILWASWNYAVVPLMHASAASFWQSILLYSIAKILTRGFASPQ